MTTDQKLMGITLEKGIEAYLGTLEIEGKSPYYIDGLKTRLRYFMDFMRQAYPQVINMTDLDLEHGREFLRSLMERQVKYLHHPIAYPREGKLSIHYMHGCGRAVRSFSSWAAEEGYLAGNVMERMKLPPIPKILPEPLNEDQIRRVLSVCLDRSLERLRNFSIMMTFLDTGLRLNELINLRLSKIDFPLGEMSIFGKGSKERMVPIGSQAKRAMIDYLSRERPEPANPQDADRVYLNADGRPITREVVEKLFQRVKVAAHLKKFHPHLCRHTFSVRYLVNGGDAFTLQKILGHTSLEMTRKYVNLASGDVKDMHRRSSPMDNLDYHGSRHGHPGRPAKSLLTERDDYPHRR